MDFVRNLFGNGANGNQQREREAGEGQIPKELLRLHPMFQSGGFTYSPEESLAEIVALQAKMLSFIKLQADMKCKIIWPTYLRVVKD